MDQSDKPKQKTLGAKASSGTVWALAGYGGAQVMRLGGNLILTRLLFKEAFGTMALVAALMQGLALFSDIGIRPSIIQNKRGDDPHFLNTAWTIQAGRGIALWLVCCIVAIPYAGFYNDVQLEQLVPVAGLTAVLAGFKSTKVITLNRDLNIRTLSIIQLAAQAIGLVAMIGWAMVDRSVWALVAGGLAAGAAELVMSHASLPGLRNRFAWDRTAAHALFTFGRWVFLSTVLSFLCDQSDRLIFGKLVTLDVLGVYSIATILAGMPSRALGHLASTVVFATYSRVVNQGGALGPVYRKARRGLLLLAGWLLTGLIAGGQAAIDVLYDERYTAAGWMVQLLSIGRWFHALESTNGAALLALGSPKWITIGNALKLVAMAAFIPLGFHLFGFPGAVAGFAMGELARYGTSAYATFRAGLRGLDHDLVMSAMVAGSGVVAWKVTTYAAEHSELAIVPALVVFMTVSAAWAPLALRFMRQRRAEGKAGAAPAQPR